MTAHFVEELCADCQGYGCDKCDETGAVEIEVAIAADSEGVASS